MGQTIEKLSIFFKILEKLGESIELFCEYKNTFDKEPNKKNEQLLMNMRDSMLWRFKRSADLFWETIKGYLEFEMISMIPEYPRGILREAVAVRLLSEDEGSECMDMIEAKNKISYIYQEIRAEEIALQAPEFYELMYKVTERMQKRWR